MSESTRFLATIIEEADRRHGDDPARALWYVLECSNLSRARARFIHEKWLAKLQAAKGRNGTAP